MKFTKCGGAGMSSSRSRSKGRSSKMSRQEQQQPGQGLHMDILDWQRFNPIPFFKPDLMFAPSEAMYS